MGTTQRPIPSQPAIGLEHMSIPEAARRFNVDEQYLRARLTFEGYLHVGSHLILLGAVHALGKERTGALAGWAA